jgi:hypothetical protein
VSSATVVVSGRLGVGTEQAEHSARRRAQDFHCAFADIKGSTELEQNLDPEEARSIIDPALKIMISAAWQGPR